VALVRTDVSEECIASVIRVKRISGLETTLAVIGYINSDDGGNIFLLNVGYFKSPTASQPRRRNSSCRGVVDDFSENVMCLVA
jgi:hypothetical protein